MKQLISLTPMKTGTMSKERPWRMQVLCLGMLSKPTWYATQDEANCEAAEVRRIPGMIPVVEYDPDNAPE